MMNAESPHNIEFEEGLRQEMEQINFELEVELEYDAEDHLKEKNELTSRIQNYFSLN